MAGHRSTLKRQNKSYKGGHSSKRSIKAASKGKVEKASANNKALKVQTKLDRKNQAKQLKQQKIQKTINERQLFNNNVTERIVVVLPLTSNISKLDIINKLLASVDEEQLQIKDDVVVQSIKVKRFKANLKIILPDMTNLISILDATKVADFVIFGLSATEEVDPKFGEQIVRATEAQGIATTFGVIPDLISSYPKRNLQMDVLKSLTSFYNHFFPNNEKLFALEQQTESLNLLRTICQKFPKSITWRDSRGWLVADKLDWINGGSSGSGSNIDGELAVEGVARGIGFNPNRLIHLPGFGDFQVARIEKMQVAAGKKGDLEMTDSESLIFEANEGKETLDELMPLEEEMEEEEPMLDEETSNWGGFGGAASGNVEIGQFNGKRPLPKGISEYQAKWLLDDEIDDLINENGVVSENEDEDEDAMDFDQDEGMMDEEFDDGSKTMSTYAPSEKFVELSEEEEARQLELFKKREKEELEFPDELELKPGESAKKRLARYRGVKSLAGCEWDYNEDDDRKPASWERYLKVRNYAATKNKVLKQSKNEVVIKAGQRCRVFLKVPSFILEKITNPQQKPFVLYSLLPHEHKQTVCNFTVQTWEDYDKPIKSKDSMIVQYGPRRVMIQPVFSQASRNTNNVAKFERFLHQGALSVATATVPVTFTNSPALFFKTQGDGSIEMVAQDS
ncbi:unnamed protein product [Ambrosiozyma monospora]|uniref:Unnamed protein product n=1 Tax=Ambrosiozyma monospora TaxID=43982 RepID=A0A9W7DD95_AMBMO|nr:unnamed protein product [Ambrosiozyma monospora]